jgi:6-phosphogluconolactonase
MTEGSELPPFGITAYNLPSTMTVHRIQQSSSIGEEVKQAAPIDRGVFAHQIRMLPSHHEPVLVTRGNNKTDTKPEDPGALKVKAFHDGQITDIDSIAPGAGYGFGPRPATNGCRTAEPASSVPAAG